MFPLPVSRGRESPLTMDLLDRQDTALLVIDVQQPLLGLAWNCQELVANLHRLVGGCGILGIPVLVALQNPDRLGPLAPEVADALEGYPQFPKMAFSCWRDQALREAMKELGKASWLLCGIEAHVCVAQTALDLVPETDRLHVVADAVGSRARLNWEVGLARAAAAGAVISSTEMALFELMKQAGTDEFRAVQRLLK